MRKIFWRWWLSIIRAYTTHFWCIYLCTIHSVVSISAPMDDDSTLTRPLQTNAKLLSILFANAHTSESIILSHSASPFNTTSFTTNGNFRWRPRRRFTACW